MTNTPKPAEHLHTKACLASALIRVIENIRDDAEETDLEFRLAAQDNYLLTIADEYLLSGIATCRCP